MFIKIEPQNRYVVAVFTNEEMLLFNGKSMKTVAKLAETIVCKIASVNRLKQALISCDGEVIVQWITRDIEDRAYRFMNNEVKAIKEEYTNWPWISIADLVQEVV